MTEQDRGEQQCGGWRLAEELADWGRAAELHVSAGRPDEGRRCVEQAAQVLSAAMAGPGAGVDPSWAPRCAEVRELALAHGLPVLAAQLGLAEAALLAETGARWAEVAARHGRIRRECARLGLETVARRGEQARVDLSLGRAALARGLADEGERLVTAAAPALRAAGLDGEAQVAEGVLLMLGVARDPAAHTGAVRERPATAWRPTAIDDVGAAIAALHALPVDDPERPARAAAIVEALAWFGPGGDPRELRPLDALLEIAEGVPETPQWVRTRIAARLLSLMRAVMEQELPDPDLAVPRLDALAEEARDDPPLAPLVELARWGVRTAQSVHHGDAGAVARMPEEIAALFDRVPRSPQVDSLREPFLAMAELMATDHRGDEALLGRLRQAAATLPPGYLRTSVEEGLRTASTIVGPYADSAPERLTDEQLRQMRVDAEGLVAGTAERAVAHTAVAGAALRGGHETDPDRVDLAVVLLRRAAEIAGPQDNQRVFHLFGLAATLATRAGLTGATRDLREAKTVLEEARATAGGPAHPQWPEVNELLAEVQRLLGAGPESHRAGVEGMRGHVWRVLAEPDLRGATAAVRRAARDAVDIARHCLSEGDPAAAATALDAGRGLALFAGTTVGTFAQRLEQSGDRELARRWRAAVTTGDPAQLPSELRRAVLRAVTDGGAADDLMDPPTYAEIQHALVVLDADALVYLVPGVGPDLGFAVCVPASGAPRYLILPNLTVENDDVTRYLEAVNRRDAATAEPVTPADPAGTGRELGAGAAARFATAVAAAVERLCDWEWDSAMGPLVESLLPHLTPPPATRPPRLVLVPMGQLARFPWQAARRPADGRYAIELVAVSQAVSARMLCRSAAQAPPAPTATGLVVGDPEAGTGVRSLAAARREALAIREVFYPGARYVGRRPNGTTSPSGAGTKAEVRAWLTAPDAEPGALLHLACHGFVRAGDRPSAYLQLVNGEKLFAEELIELMAPTPDRVGLAVLAACHTGVSMTGYDEAYSLGTAFLAAGVRSVLCTQWGVEDEETAVLMFMFHHFLNDTSSVTTGVPVWAALRAAQRWMLDPHRTVPPAMPKPLRERLAPEKLPEVVSWAAFVHWGR